MKQRSIGVPASFFAMVLGLTGLGNDWRLAAKTWNLPTWIGEAIMLIAFILWLGLCFSYAAKWIWRREEALAELNHPIQCCFIGLLPVSTALIALAVLPHARTAAIGLFIADAIGTLGFSVWRSGGLWRGNRDPSTTTPVLYLPSVAGNFVIAIVAGALGWRDWGQLFFGAGLLTWLALESVVLHRLLVIEPLALPLRPTLGIQFAPPAVGLVAYLSVTDGDSGLIGQILLGYALLQALILLRLLPWIREQSFTAGYWAFSFGGATLALGALLMVDRGATGPARELAPILFVIANLIIGGISIGSIMLLVRRQLLPPQNVGPGPSIPRRAS